ncbi:MAG: OmpA family protein, partial [Bacteroidales bacterium]|nr:OmpA family protein [Bacteroidales bacterium]
QLIYFLRHQVVSDAKTERKEGGKMSIYSATLGKNGKWTRILPINPAVSFGFVQDVRLMRDGKTLLYSTRPEKKSNARPVFTRKIIAGQWLIPEFMNEDDSKDFRCIQNAGSHVYVLMHYNRKSDYYMIFRTEVDPKYSTNNVVTESGKVINKLNNRPLEATFTVLNPTTNDVIGVYTTDPTDGTYHITADPKESYLVETRAEGFSFHSQLTEYNGKEEVLLAKTIELFDTASVGITLFDADIFQPINGKVIAVRQTDKAIFRSVKGRNGWYQLKLPLGGDYNIIATAKGFGQNSFLFKVTGDITFDHYERELSMSPVRRDVTVKIIDDETLAPISSEALFKSLDRNETINKTADAVKISLREGDKYNITVHPNGYMFANLTIDLSKDSLTEIEIPLTALRVGANLRLNNILFDTNQAFLRPESYAELDRVVRLMEENPDLNILIQAHTDNVGNNASNKRLSDRRAASAMQYLLENGVAQSRMSSIGFGATKPIADNGTEEGRQLNRRVELLITE